MVDPALAPDPVHLLNPQAPPALSLVVQKAMQTEKSRRWGSAAEFKAALFDAVVQKTRKTQLSRRPISGPGLNAGRGRLLWWCCY